MAVGLGQDTSSRDFSLVTSSPGKAGGIQVTRSKRE